MAYYDFVANASSGGSGSFGSAGPLFCASASISSGTSFVVNISSSKKPNRVMCSYRASGNTGNSENWINYDPETGEVSETHYWQQTSNGGAYTKKSGSFYTYSSNTVNFGSFGTSVVMAAIELIPKS